MSIQNTLKEHSARRDSFVMIQVLPGWEALVSELHRQLVEVDPDYGLIQVKEKFGTLRFYATPSDQCSSKDRFYEVIHDAECKSASMCDECGKAGKRVEIRGWTMTRCEEHNGD